MPLSASQAPCLPSASPFNPSCWWFMHSLTPLNALLTSMQLESFACGKMKFSASMQLSKLLDAASHRASTLYRLACHCPLLMGPNFVM
eukprot:CAMPEP_0114159326 /NCGR_PEP_ID=MMETSP0043_2-20121206/27721_1 /TAXON_ID=464988 /ORGANISM="Hemiselmis andersenii, Strain CCMP644" /LENGTH=87 /DNA_ID=CAMNT_0001255205 /DNA_START=197 /DNA_END=460 /DNA_ORIENTATION=-